MLPFIDSYFLRHPLCFDKFMALTGSNNWLSLSFRQTKSTVKGSSSSHLPGREGKESRSSIPCPAGLSYENVCRKSGDGGEDGYVWHTVHIVLVLILCIPPYFTAKNSGTLTQTHTHFQIEMLCWLCCCPRCLFSVFGNRHQSTWRLISNSSDQSWSISASAELLLKRHLLGLLVVSLGVWISPKWVESKLTWQPSGCSRNDST